MKQINILKTTALFGLIVTITACQALRIPEKRVTQTQPEAYEQSTDTTNSGAIRCNDFFKDPFLIQLIDSALLNNQELNIMTQEIQMARNEVQARKGEYLPFVGAGAAAEVEKVGRYTSKGSSEATTEIKPGIATPEPLPNFMFGLNASWEVDIWKKLRNAKTSANNRYLASAEGRNFMVTHLVSEIAHAYYELLALDNQLQIVQQNIEIQSNALKIVRLEKEATRVTELAVRKFEAEVYHTRSLIYNIQQQITVTENRINYLVGRFPQKVQRSVSDFNSLVPETMAVGVPLQLLQNRADIKQAELELSAAHLDIKVAKALFYPSLRLQSGIGYQAFNPRFLLSTPQSLLFAAAGDLMAPLINRNAIKATYYNANAKQIQAVYNYERTILNAYTEVVNYMAGISNLTLEYDLRNQQVQALNQSVTISTNLFKSARADYMEVLLTQRDALESKFELIETKMKQMSAVVSMYRALGGGWR